LSNLSVRRLIALFRTIDKDDSGKIEVSELKAFLTEEGGDEEKAQKVADMIVSQVDKDGDGTIDIQEFVGAVVTVLEPGLEGDALEFALQMERELEAFKKMMEAGGEDGPGGLMLLLG
jgi:hypothetical protein